MGRIINKLSEEEINTPVEAPGGFPKTAKGVRAVSLVICIGLTVYYIMSPATQIDLGYGKVNDCYTPLRNLMRRKWDQLWDVDEKLVDKYRKWKDEDRK
mmetsp:Transcript_10039/g.18096  ORF Transcript_10039/g.18096 Transcript_10039/m.18096 type:complete len:99 (+) Transcript_10039:1341-1637(+)